MRNPISPAQRVLQRIKKEELAFLVETSFVPQDYTYKDSLEKLVDICPQIALSTPTIRPAINITRPQGARIIPIRPKIQNLQDSLDLLLELANANSKANSTKGRQI